MSTKVVLYNHALDISFVLITSYQDASDASVEELLEALERRVQYLKDHPDEVKEAIGFGDDSYQEVYDLSKPLEAQCLSTFCKEHIVQAASTLIQEKGWNKP